MTKLNRWKMACGVVVLCAATAVPALAQTFSSLASFDGTNGTGPYLMSLVQGADGDLYGTTSWGGAYNGGTVFKMTPAGVVTTLHSFCENGFPCADGLGPFVGLVLAADGNFYGTTNSGGANDYGTIFKITPSGTFTTLYSLAFADGYGPDAPLAQGIDGNFYGTVGYAGPKNAGSVFKITPAGVFTTLHQFDSTDGAGPSGGLIQGSDGYFYGTSGGGKYGAGTVFRITTHGEFKTLVNFDWTNGGFPQAGLVQSTDGNFYGTTSAGGTNEFYDYGTVFRMTPEGQVTTLYSFCAQTNCTDGDEPYAGLVRATDGNFYGTTGYGGEGDCTNGDAPGCGTMFRITAGGTMTKVYAFCNQINCADGDLPLGGLLQATDGILYGVTQKGGNGNCNNGCGTAFSLDIGLGPFVSFVRAAGKVGQTGGILGQGFTGTTSVSINGIPANFKVVSDTFLKATVPPGATTGYVTVTTPSGTLTSNVPFHVIP
jgi:uncharacterized repeat protein (TIGR03803 family)